MTSDDQQDIVPGDGGSPDTTQDQEPDKKPDADAGKVEPAKPKRFDEMTLEEARAAAKEQWIINKKLKEAKEQKVEQTKAQPSNSAPDGDELRLIARGFSDKDIALLKKIQAGSKVEGKEITLAQATEDEMFKLYKAEEDRKARSDKAQMGPARGGVQAAPGIKPGMSREEHMKVWKESQNG